MRNRGYIVFGVIILWNMMACAAEYEVITLSASTEATDEEEEMEEDEETTGGICERTRIIELSLTFPEYFSGDFFIALDDGEASWRYHVKGAIQQNMDAFELSTCSARVSVFAWNDLVNNGTWDQTAEASARTEVLLGDEEIQSIALSLHLPFQDVLGAFPKQAIVYLNWDVNSDPDFMERLAAGNLVVVDHAVAQNTPSYLVRLRELHPEMILLLYVDPTSVRDFLRSSLEYEKAAYLEKTVGQIGIGEIFGYMPGQWNGSYVSKLQYWPQSTMVNMTKHVKLVNPNFFGDWMELHQTYLQDVFQEGLFDGLFVDNVLHTYAWIMLREENGVEWLDANYDRIENELIDVGGGYYQIDLDLIEGMEEFLWLLRPQISGQIVCNEGNSKYLSFCDGKYFENVIDFRGVAPRFREVLAKARGTLSVWNTEINDPSDILKCRFDLLLATVLGGFHACESPSDDAFWDVDEYHFRLGRRVGEVSWEQGLMLGVFEYGVVLINPHEHAVTVRFSRQLFAFSGSQRPDLNTGRSVEQITLASEDGVMLQYQ